MINKTSFFSDPTPTVAFAPKAPDTSALHHEDGHYAGTPTAEQIEASENGNKMIEIDGSRYSVTL